MIHEADIGAVAATVLAQGGHTGETLTLTGPAVLTPIDNDSPLGLAAWIVSFVNTGAAANQIEAAFGSRDELLTNIMIYWVTQIAGSAARMYLETARAAYGQAAGMPSPQRSQAPAAVALFPREAQFPREWAKRRLNVQRFTQMARGGHFAALETPDLLVADLRAFFHTLR